jgi:hypothetical protein
LKIWMLPKKRSSWTLKHFVWLWLLWSKTLSDFILNIQWSWVLRCTVRSCSWHSIILDATLEALVLNFEHLGWYALRHCPWITNILNLGCHAVRPCHQSSNTFDATVSGLVLKFQTCLMLLCKILSLTFQHLGCYGVRFCP